MLALSWLAFPWWAPLVAGRFLPSGWTVSKLVLGWPGLRGVEVRQVSARGLVVGVPMDIEATGLAVSWRGPRYEIDGLSIGLAPSASGRPGIDSLDDLYMPRLLFPVDAPSVQVDRLAISGLGTPDGSLELHDLDLEGGGEGPVALDTGIREIPGIGRPGHLSLLVSSARFQLSLGLVDAEQAALELTQTDTAGQLRSELTVTLPLEAADPGQLLAMFGLTTPASTPTESASGRVTAAFEFTGSVPQRVTGATIDLQAANLRSGATAISADLRATATIESGVARVSLSRPIAVALEGRPGHWPSAATVVLDGLGLALPPAGDDVLSVRLETLPGAGIVLGVDRPWPLDFEGDANVDLAQAETSNLTAELRGARLGVHGLSPMAGFDLECGIGWNASLDGPLSVSLDTGTVDLTGIDSRGSGTVSFTGSSLDRFDADTLHAGIRTTTLALGEAGQTVAIDDLSASGSLAVDAAGWRFSGPLKAGSLALDGPAEGAVRLEAGAWSAELSAEATSDALTSSGKGQLASVSLPDLGIEAAQVSGGWRNLDIGALSGTANISTTGLAVTLDDTVYEGFDIDVTARLPADGPVTGTGTAHIGDDTALPFEYSADVEAGITTARLDDANLQAAAVPGVAAALRLPWPEAVYLSAGTLVLDGEATLADGLTGAITVTGEGLEGGFAESALLGGRLDLAVGIGETFTGEGRFEADRASLAAGLDVTSLGMDLELSVDADVIARNVTGVLFEGGLLIEEITVRDGGLESTVVDWTGFDLAQLLAFAAVDGLDGSGTMNARIPVAMVDEGIAVDHGSFEATTSGRIAYSAGGPATNIGLRALENFHYDTFTGTIDYDPAGPYAVRMDLLGRNPDLYGGHPVKFGLNLGGEMPAVFRSLFLTGSFEEALLESLRESNLPIP